MRYMCTCGVSPVRHWCVQSGLLDAMGLLYKHPKTALIFAGKRYICFYPMDPVTEQVEQTICALY